jgi:acyl-CoA synthetase (AMP-forming)/AMP-acid ligase II
VPGIADYVIAGVADASGLLEQVPWAFVVPSAPEAWTPEEFLTLARARLPSHMVPRRAVPVARLPLRPSGKHDRRAVVELYGPKSARR